MPLPSERDELFSRRFYKGLAAVAAVSLVAIATIVWFFPAKREALAFEAGKTLMQVIGVGTLGAVLSFAVNSFTLRHQARAADRQLWHTSVEAERVRAHSNWQRSTDLRKDERFRLDELRNALLESTIENYNEVKRARRRLRVAGYGPGRIADAATTADREAVGLDPVARLQMSEPQPSGREETSQRPGDAKSRGGKAGEDALAIHINELDRISEAQLQFERLAKVAHLARVKDKRISSAKIKLENCHEDLLTLQDAFAACTSYLKELSAEKLPAPTSPEFEGLYKFLDHRDTGGFKAFSTDVNTAVLAIRAELTRRITLPQERTKRFDIDLDRVHAQHIELRERWETSHLDPETLYSQEEGKADSG